MTATATATKRRAKGISIETASLKQALADISKAIPARNSRPILQNVLLSEGRMIGTDLEVQVSTPIDWTGEPLLLPHARMMSILKEAHGDTVTITPDDMSVTVAIGRGKWRMPCESPTEFPSWSPASLKSVVRIPCDQFARAVKATVRATDEDSSRFALGGVCVDVSTGSVAFVATDGRRLTAFTAQHGQSVDESQTLVPARAMAILGTLAKRHEDSEVQLEVCQSDLVAQIGDTTVTAKLLQGRFPRWRELFTKAVVDSEPAIVDREELISATRAAAIVTTENSKGVDFTFGESDVKLHGVSSEFGESLIAFDLQQPGPRVTVKLDPAFVCQFLEGLADEATVCIRATTPHDAVMLSTDDCRGIIMPLSKD